MKKQKRGLAKFLTLKMFYFFIFCGGHFVTKVNSHFFYQHHILNFFNPIWLKSRKKIYLSEGPFFRCFVTKADFRRNCPKYKNALIFLKFFCWWKNEWRKSINKKNLNRLALIDMQHVYMKKIHVFVVRMVSSDASDSISRNFDFMRFNILYKMEI
jgi:hypothetical protein